MISVIKIVHRLHWFSILWIVEFDHYTPKEYWRVFDNAKIRTLLPTLLKYFVCLNVQLQGPWICFFRLVNLCYWVKQSIFFHQLNWVHNKWKETWSQYHSIQQCNIKDLLMERKVLKYCQMRFKLHQSWYQTSFSNTFTLRWQY